MIDTSDISVHLHPYCTYSTEGASLVIEGPRRPVTCTNNKESHVLLDELAQDGLPYERFSELYMQSYRRTDQYSQNLKKIKEEMLLQYHLLYDGDALCIIEPFSVDYKIEVNCEQVKGDFKWSSYALIRLAEESLVLESPVAHSRVYIKNKGLWDILFLLSEEKSKKELLESTGIDKGLLNSLLSILYHNKIINGCDPQESAAYSNLKQWEFHDLYYHSRSRLGRTNNPYGTQYRFEGEVKPEPVVKEPPAGKKIVLPHVDPYQYHYYGPLFFQVLESRFSRRSPANAIITLAQLGEFLFRSLRLRVVSEWKEPMQVSSRPYPSGGASYEMEVYLTVNVCDGLTPGFYHYCPKNHFLTFMKPSDKDTYAFLSEAAWAYGSSTVPQVMIHLAARYPRISYRYVGMGYSTVLKNVGVLYQTFYLVATALGLSSCALGGGNADRFARLSGIDYLDEAAVGEFTLNGAPLGPEYIGGT